MTTRVRRSLYLLGLAIGVGLFLIQLTRSTKSLAQIDLSSGTLDELTLILGLATLAQFIPTLAWRILLSSFGVNMPWIETIRGYSLTFIPRYIPGSVWGYLSRNEWLRTTTGIDFVTSSSLSIIEVCTIVLTGCMVSSFRFVPDLRALPAYILISGAVIVSFGSWLFIRTLAGSSLARSKLGHTSTLRPLAGPKLGSFLATMYLHLGMWLLYGWVLQRTIAIVSLPPQSSVIAMASVYSTSWLAGFLALIVPSGVGVRELALTSLLANVGIAVSSQAAAIAILMRFVLIAGELVWLGISQAIAALHNLLSTSAPQSH